MMSKLTGGVLGLVLVVAPSFADDPPASPEVTATLQPYLDSYKVAGAIGVIANRDGKVHYRNLLGYADVEAKRPIAEDNVFWIASMSKMFAGASVMMLVDEGKVSVDDPVEKYLPEFAGQMVIVRGDKQLMVLEPVKRPILVREGGSAKPTIGPEGFPQVIRSTARRASAWMVSEGASPPPELGKTLASQIHRFGTP